MVMSARIKDPARGRRDGQQDRGRFLDELRGMKICIVEDDDQLRDLIIEELRHEGGDVTGFPSADPLYRHLLEHQCDAVVLDVVLPGEDGYSVAGFLGRIAPETGIVMLTGRGSAADMARGLLQGADLYLVKPLDLPLLTAGLVSLRRKRKSGALALKNEMATGQVQRDWTLLEDGWTLASPQQGLLSLTHAERSLLGRLFHQRGETVAREVLIAAMTDTPWDFDPHRIEVLVHRLRSRVLAATGMKLPLRAVRGQGYLLGKE